MLGSGKVIRAKMGMMIFVKVGMLPAESLLLSFSHGFRNFQNQNWEPYPSGHQDTIHSPNLMIRNNLYENDDMRQDRRQTVTKIFWKYPINQRQI